MGGAERTELGRADLGPRAKVETFEGRRAPSRVRLPPSDIADLRYVFCEMATEAGVRSAQAHMAEVMAKKRGEKLEAGRKRGGPKPTKAQRDLGASGPNDTTLAALRAIMGDDTLDPEHVGIGKVEENESTSGVAVIIKPPRGISKKERRPPAYDEAERATLRTGDGREVVAYGGVSVRTFPPSTGATLWLLKCKGDDGGASRSESSDLEDWIDSGSDRHRRGWLCRSALLRMETERGGALHVVVLHRAYGYAPPNLGRSHWEREIAALVLYTPTVRTMCAEAAGITAGARVKLADAAAKQQATRAAEDAARIELALADLEPSIVRREAAIAAGDVVIAKLDARIAKSAGAAKARARRALHRKRKKRLALQAQRKHSLERFRATLPDRRAKLEAALLLARRMLPRPTAVPVREASAKAIVAGAAREVSPSEVLRAALDTRPAPKGRETRDQRRERERAGKAERSELVVRLGREAEQLLIAASNAYRRARGSL